MLAPQAPILEISKVSKGFPGVQALKEVDFVVQAGEVHALLGENGAGKSTLVNLIGGVFSPDTGSMAVAGSDVRFRDPRSSWEHGIAVIHQELALIPEMSLAENIFLGRLPHQWGRLDWRDLARRAALILQRIGLDVYPDTLVSELSTGEQQLVEIARAIASEPKLLVMDEPTSALSGNEVERLFSVIRNLRSAGLSTIFISHRLEEVLALADRLTVLRDGRVVLVRPVGGVTPSDIAEAMIGSALNKGAKEVSKPRRDDVARLEIRGLVAERLRGVNLSVWPGEVVGIAGPLGAGKTELLRALAGIDPIAAGEVSIDGRQTRIASPANAIAHKMFMVPEDRKRDGLVLEMSVANNITLPFLHRFESKGIFSFKRQAATADSLIAKLGVKTPSRSQTIAHLSGGNQQKAILARWLAMDPLILLLDQPTRGLDVGAKQEVYRLVRELSRRGIAIIYVATEIPELMEVCDRLYVMRDGDIVDMLDDLTASSEETVFLAAFGPTAQ